MTTVVIDANLALALAIPLPYSDRARILFEEWKEKGQDLVAPSLWGYEVISGLRKSVVLGVLTSEQADDAVQHLWALDTQQLSATLEQHRRAIEWAERLEHTVAYDAHYLVVAEDLGAPFWTADGKLAKKARSIGADWVHWIHDLDD